MDSEITYLKKSAKKERMDYKIASSKKAAMKGNLSVGGIIHIRMPQADHDCR